jgi:hypothetical protein
MHGCRGRGKGDQRFCGRVRRHFKAIPLGTGDGGRGTYFKISIERKQGPNKHILQTRRECLLYPSLTPLDDTEWGILGRT